jgi:putative FmdB family regulatory protein
MPIYEYRCSSCGVQNDVMQKMSDAELTTCPSCGKETYSKQLSAAGFQLKGNGYYVTDFKNKPAPACGTSACGACPSANGNA